MATTKNWTGGANDGDLANLSNWDEGTAFANGDTLKIGATNQNINAVTHAFTGIILIVTEGFGGNIGSASGPVSFSSVASLQYAGRGAFASFGSAGTITTASFEHVVGNVYIATGTWTQLTNTNGNLDIAAAAVVTRFDNIGGTGAAQYNATGFTNFYNGGSYTYYRAATNLYCLKGSTVQKNRGTSTYLGNTTVYVYNGATYNKQSGGADTTAYVFPGAKYTTAGNQGGSGTTVDLGDVQIWSGSTVVATAVPGVTFDVTGLTYKGASYSTGGNGVGI